MEKTIQEGENGYIVELPRKKIRREVHTRKAFAMNQALHWYGKMHHIIKIGNILTSKATMKFLQARRIYIHYSNEFQKCQNLPLSK